MDLRTRLEDEEIFCSNNKKNLNRIKKLNYAGIFTIENFINADIDLLTKTPYLSKQYKAFQKILRYKYCNDVLPQDILLYKNYDIDTIDYRWENVMLTLEDLGFGKVFFIDIRNALIARNSSGNIKIIDILREAALKDYVEQNRIIAKFYVDYYDKEILKNHETETSINSIKDLKKQLASLINQKNQLDDKIFKLTEQVKMLEERQSKNGRK
ncbi:MAG: hypothetical protein PUD59_00045 [bacterium]|nr:hypothetical protein [bacterium]